MTPYDMGLLHGHKVAAQGREVAVMALKDARRRRKNPVIRYLWPSRRRFLDAFILRLQQELDQRSGS